MGRERTGGDFGRGKARQSATLWDVSIRSETAATELQNRCLSPAARPGWVLDQRLLDRGCSADRQSGAYGLLSRCGTVVGAGAARTTEFGSASPSSGVVARGPGVVRPSRRVTPVTREPSWATPASSDRGIIGYPHSVSGDGECPSRSRVLAPNGAIPPPSARRGAGDRTCSGGIFVR
jgi:hypothetical protein